MNFNSVSYPNKWASPLPTCLPPPQSPSSSLVSPSITSKTAVARSLNFSPMSSAESPMLNPLSSIHLSNLPINPPTALIISNNLLKVFMRVIIPSAPPLSRKSPKNLMALTIASPIVFATSFNGSTSFIT